MKITLALLFLFLFGTVPEQKHERIMIGAASDLKFALDSVISAYQQTHPGTRVQVSYGSSGKLFEQISNGAPFDIYFSADIGYPAKLVQKGVCAPPVYTYGYGRLVLWSRKGDPAKTGMDLLLHPDIKKIAIANPLHAPYGKRAMESIRYYSLEEKISGKLVYGENIAQTAQFVSSGAADAGIIALALVVSPNMKALAGNYFIIPSESFTPLRQGFVVLKRGEGRKEVDDFTAYMNHDSTRRILEYFGFQNKP